MAWNDVYASPDNQPAQDTSPDLRVTLPPVYAPSLGVLPGGDTAPPAQKPPILNTSWTNILDGQQYQMTPEAKRVVGAATDAFNATPSIITPAWQERMNAAPEPSGWINRNIVNPAFTGVGYGLGGVAAAGAGLAALVGGAADRAGLPGNLQRDIVMGSEVLPEAQGLDLWHSAVTRGAPRLEAPGPRYAPPPSPDAPPGGGASAADVARVAENQRRRAGPPSYQTPSIPLSDTGIEPPIAPPFVPPTTLPEAKAVTGQWYDAVRDNANTALTPQYATQGLDAAIKKLTLPGPLSTAIGSDDAASKLAINLNAGRDQPITLGDYTRADQKLTGMVDNEVKPDGSLSQTGRDIQQVQYDLRDHYNNAGPDDVVGGQSGFDLLDPARKAASQTFKIGDVTDMLRRATTLTDNPQTAIRTQMRSYLNSDGSRGLSDMERALLEQGAERGTLGNAVRMLTNQFVAPVVGGMLGGPTGVFMGKAASEGGLGLSGAMARARLQGVIPKLGESIPPPPGLLSLPTGS